MDKLNAVPDLEPENEQLELGDFEGLRVARYRLNPGSVGAFPCFDEDGQPLKLQEGDVVAIQVEVFVTHVDIGSRYKGGIQTDARTRTHHGRAQPGTATVVGVRHRGQA